MNLGNLQAFPIICSTISLLGSNRSMNSLQVGPISSTIFRNSVQNKNSMCVCKQEDWKF